MTTQIDSHHSVRKRDSGRTEVIIQTMTGQMFNLTEYYVILCWVVTTLLYYVLLNHRYSIIVTWPVLLCSKLKKKTTEESYGSSLRGRRAIHQPPSPCSCEIIFKLNTPLLVWERKKFILIMPFPSINQ